MVSSVASPSTGRSGNGNVAAELNFVAEFRESA